jgi:uncharacterized protein
MTQDQERTWAIISHVGSFVGVWLAGLGLLAPLVVFLVKGNESQFVRANAVESLNFQITVLIAAIVSFILAFVIIGIFMLIALGIAFIVFVILGTMAASRNEVYHYPISLRLVK